MKRLILLLLCLIVGACSAPQEPALVQTPVVANTPKPVAQTSDPSPTMIPSPTQVSSPTETTVQPLATATIPIVVTATPNAPETLEGGSPTVTLTPIEPEEAPMVVVPAGEFIMGSTTEQVEDWDTQWSIYVNELEPICESPKCGNSEAMSNELYQFTAYLEEFEIDQFEVTNYQYRQCVQAGVCSNPKGIDALYLPKFYIRLAVVALRADCTAKTIAEIYTVSTSEGNLFTG